MSEWCQDNKMEWDKTCVSEREWYPVSDSIHGSSPATYKRRELTETPDYSVEVE